MSDSSKSQIAYDFVRGEISRGAYGPGYRLVLATIADELGMSVVPVREAIRRLEAQGLVSFERNVGARVATIDPADLSETTETLAIVEGAAIACAMPLINKDVISKARKLNLEMRASLEAFDPLRFTRTNEVFHRSLSDPCPNAQLVSLVDASWTRLSQIRQSTFAFVPERARQSVTEHDEILDLIERKADPLELELAVRKHRLASLNAFIDRTHERELEPNRKERR